jgi:integrase
VAAFPSCRAWGYKYKAALSVAYGAGLRATEVVSLKVSDIDSKRMIIRGGLRSITANASSKSSIASSVMGMLLF